MNTSTKKQLTQDAVKSALDFLIELNSNTSTKEVKDYLREDDYFAEQSEVHKFVEIIFAQNRDNYNREMTTCANPHYEYTAKTQSTLLAAATSVLNNNTSSTSQNTNKVSTSTSQSSTPAPTQAPTSSLMQKTTPVTGKVVVLFELTKDKAEDAMAKYPNRNDWVVSKKDMGAKDVYYIFNGSATSDQVRSRVASINKLKSADIRAARVDYRFPVKK